MKSKFLFTSELLILPFFIVTLSLSNVSCGGKDKKNDDGKTSTETTVGPSKGSDDGMVPKIDTAALKDEASTNGVSPLLQERENGLLPVKKLIVG